MAIFVAAFGYRFALKLVDSGARFTATAIHASDSNKSQSLDDNLPTKQVAKSKRRYATMIDCEQFVMQIMTIEPVFLAMTLITPVRFDKHGFAGPFDPLRPPIKACA